MKKKELLASLFDTDLQGLDSEFSYSTRALVKRFDADGAHLNRWWVMTPTDWVCPSCKRTKSEIVRPNKNNFLICQLHEHHDHMKDIVKSLFETISIKQKNIVADKFSEKFAIKVAFSLSAYDNTVICFDCNKADADAKRIVRAHKYFSFSPTEIGLFVKASSNKEHQIDEIIAKNVWENAEPVFLIRLKMAETFATFAAEKKDWYQPSGVTARQTERIAKHYFKLNGLLEIDAHEPERLLYNPEPFKGQNNSWRTRINRTINRFPDKA